MAVFLKFKFTDFLWKRLCNLRTHVTNFSFRKDALCFLVALRLSTLFYKMWLWLLFVKALLICKLLICCVTEKCKVMRPSACTKRTEIFTLYSCDLLTMASVLYAGITCTAFVVIYLLLKMFKKEQKTKKPKPGMVILHQFPPTNLVASGSPPCLKLEVFLRMTKIPYENEYGFEFSKKGKMPWIEFNGQEIADSNFCIQFLKREFKVDVDSHLTNTEKAIAHSVRTMLEENTYW